MSVTIESYAVAQCPKCKKREVLPRIHAPAGHRNVRYFAIKHGDHAFVVGFDRFGVVRTTSAYDYVRGGEVVGKCPKCGQDIYINRASSNPQANDHGDHITVVFPIGNKFGIEVYDVISPLRIFPKPSIIKMLVRELGRSVLADILFQIYARNKQEFVVPPSAHENLKKLVRDVFGITLKLRPGPIRTQENQLSKYFEKAISEAEDLTYLEGISILRDSISVLDGLYNSLRKVRALEGFQRFCEELNKVKKGSIEAYYVLREMFPVKCPEK